MASFEIVKGDYGKIYRGIIENADFSDHTAVIYVWDKDRTKIIDGKPCTVTFSDPDTHIDFTPAEGDFDVEPGTYYGLFKLAKAGAVERTLPFHWEVFQKEP